MAGERIFEAGELCFGLGEEAGKVFEDGEERRKIRKPVASRAARIKVIGLVRRNERESAMDGLLRCLPPFHFFSCQHLAQPTDCSDS